MIIGCTNLVEVVAIKLEKSRRNTLNLPNSHFCMIVPIAKLLDSNSAIFDEKLVENSVGKLLGI